MDQGVAAVWAGVAGLVGAGIGGGAAAWGAWIGGKKTVEAAVSQTARQATLDFQHWQRQERSEAYRGLAAVGQEVISAVRDSITEAEWADLSSRMTLSMIRVRVAGPARAAGAAGDLVEVFIRVSTRRTGTLGLEHLVAVEWDNAMREFITVYDEFVVLAGNVLDQAPT